MGQVRSRLISLTSTPEPHVLPDMHVPILWAVLLCVGLVLYAYCAYPLIVAALARLDPAPVTHSAKVATPRISIVIAVFNERLVIERRLRELARLCADYGQRAEIIVVSDGSTDGTPDIVTQLGLPSVRLISLEANRGKAHALTAGCSRAEGDIVVFADARQSWPEDTLRMLLMRFEDPRVGGVSGDLVIQAPMRGAKSGVGLYWKYEKWIRWNEGVYRSTVGVSGSISAIRRELFEPIPDGTILDDLWWPLHVVMKGHRVVHEPRAQALDIAASPASEFRRKVRTLGGNLQLLQLLPACLSIRRNPVWWQFLSHKLLRLAVPWAMIIILLGSALSDSALLRLLLWMQLALYALCLLGLSSRFQRAPLLGALGSFLLLNAAAFVAFWVWVTGKSHRAWVHDRQRD